jgi:hypothetical protein
MLKLIITLSILASASTSMAAKYRYLSCGNPENGQIYKVDLKEKKMGKGAKPYGSRTWHPDQIEIDTDAKISVVKNIETNGGRKNMIIVKTSGAFGIQLIAYMNAGVLENGAKDSGEGDSGVGEVNGAYLICALENK